jgi:hypothetical protein
VTEMADRERLDDERLGRETLLKLYDQQLIEIRACLDFAHRNLAFYAGLPSAILAGLLNATFGQQRVLALLIGPALILVLAEVGHSVATAFYHRFIDATLTALNVQEMLGLHAPTWLPEPMRHHLLQSRYGGFTGQWVGLRDWLRQHAELDLEAAKQTILDQQPSSPIDLIRRIFSGSTTFRAATLTTTRMTMWAFEVAGLSLTLPIISAALSPKWGRDCHCHRRTDLTSRQSTPRT